MTSHEASVRFLLAARERGQGYAGANPGGSRYRACRSILSGMLRMTCKRPRHACPSHAVGALARRACQSHPCAPCSFGCRASIVIGREVAEIWNDARWGVRLPGCLRAEPSRDAAKTAPCAARGRRRLARSVTRAMVTGEPTTPVLRCALSGAFLGPSGGWPGQSPEALTYRQ